MYWQYAITEAILPIPSGCDQEAYMMQKLLKFFDERKTEKWKATNNIKLVDYQNQIKVPTYLIGEPDIKFWYLSHFAYLMITSDYHMYVH